MTDQIDFAILQDKRLRKQKFRADLQQNPILQVRILKGVAMRALRPDIHWPGHMGLARAVYNLMDILHTDDVTVETDYLVLLDYTKDKPVFPITQNDINMIGIVFDRLKVNEYKDRTFVAKLVEQIIIPWYEGGDVIALKLAFDP